MKKFTFLFLISTTIFTITSNAQIKKGSVLLGGNFSLSAYKTNSGSNTTKQTNFSISPLYGKAIKDNVIAGVFCNVEFQKNDDVSPSSSSKQKQYGGGVFIRKYKFLGKSDFSVFLQGNLSYNYTHWESQLSFPAIQTHRIYNLNSGLYPGVSYTVSRRLQVEMGFNSILNLGFSSETNKTNGSFPTSTKTTGFYLYSSLINATALNVGFRLLLNKNNSLSLKQKKQ